MLSIAILGCGQIGSRHLQSLALLEEPARIHLVDPFAQSLDTAESRFAQVVSAQKAPAFQLVRHAAAATLPAELDVAIIASSSFQRAALCQELLAVSRPRFLLLEKFLFPRAADYGSVGALIQSASVPVFVNQWMATTYAFQRLAAWLGEGVIDMRVSGTGWGLCCNAVHYIEPFQKLNGGAPVQVVSTDFAPGFEESKRNGYREIFGSFGMASANGARLELSCQSGSPGSGIQIELATGGRRVRVQFLMDRFECSFENGAENWSEVLWVPMQSQLTHRMIQQFLIEKRCPLPTYETSAAQHLLVLEAFLDHFRQSDPSVGEICPVT